MAGLNNVAALNILISARDRASAIFSKISKNLLNMKTIAAGAAVAISAYIGKQSIDAFASFEKTLTDSIVMFDNVSKAMEEKMAKAARKLAMEIPRSANDIAKAYYYLGSAGLDASTALKSLTTIGKFAVATNLSMADAAQTAATVLKTYQIPVSKLSHYLDMMTTGMKNALMTQEDMNEALSIVGGTAKNFGIDLKEVISALAIFADAGIRGSMAGTSLRRILVNLLAPNKNIKEAMDELGLKVYGANGKFRGFTTVLLDLMDKLRGLTEEQRNHYIEVIAGTRAVSAFNKILSVGKDRVLELQNVIENSNGTIDQMAKKVGETTAAKIQKLKNTFHDLEISIGEALLPALQTLLKIMQPIANVMEKHGKIIGILIGLIGSLAAAYLAYKVAMIAVSAAQGMATAAQWALNASLWACPITWIVAAIVGLIAVIYLMVKHWDKVKTALEKVWNFLKEAFGKVVNAIKNGIHKVVEFVKEFPSKILSFFVNAGKWLINAGKQVILGFIIGYLNMSIKVWEFFRNIPSKIISFFKSAGNWLINAGKNVLFGFIKGEIIMAAKLWGFLKSIPKKILSFFVNANKWLFEVGIKIIEGLANGIKNAFHKVGEAIKSIGKKIVDGFKSFFHISSPSKLMEKYGVNIVEGVNEGIKKSKIATINIPVLKAEYKSKLASVNIPIVKTTPILTYPAPNTIYNKPSERKESKQINANIKIDIAEIRNYSDIEDLAKAIAIAVKSNLIEGVKPNFSLGGI